MSARFSRDAEIRTLQAELSRSLAHVRELDGENRKLLAAAGDARTREADAHEAQQRQTALLMMVAHELRNPLMPLRLAAHMLDGARGDGDAHARLQATIKGQVAQMSRLINDLVDGSRLRAGNFRIERTLVEVVPLLDLAIESARARIDSRRQRFDCVMPAGSLKVLGDPVRLVQVFGNLLDNSSKYTPEGGEISLEVDRGASAVAVTVRDNGIGITEEALPRVFDMFVRDAHAVEADSAGLGIGLAVVHQLVKAHEGTVVARSRGRNRGSEFVVTLPAHIPAAPVACP
ncbi:MAG TPA: HAMP domain-containing sensor histidine kinase [Ramlibacter sp.]|nr:HAMP domain-containing sensor histidine kinase [Ramlibacter sp.]